MSSSSGLNLYRLTQREKTAQIVVSYLIIKLCSKEGKKNGNTDAGSTEAEEIKDVF